MTNENNLEDHFLNPQISFKLIDFTVPLIGPLDYCARNYTQSTQVKVPKITRVKDVAYQFYATALTVGPVMFGVDYVIREWIGEEKFINGLDAVVRLIK